MPVTSDFDPASPSGMVLSYLRSKGLTPDANNVRSALETQARGGNLMPGLVTEEPPPAEDRHPSRTTRNVARDVESSGERPLPTPPIPPAGYAPTGTDVGKETSAPPPSGFATSGLGDLIIAGVPALGMGAGAAYYLNRGGPTPGGNVPPPPDVGATAPATGDQYRVMPNTAPEEDPFNLMKAIQGREALPPGVGPVDAVNAANPQGVQVQPPPEPLALPPPASQARPPGEPPIPIAPKRGPYVSIEQLPPPVRTRPPLRLRVPG